MPEALQSDTITAGPLLIFDGNCQSHQMASIFGSMTGVDAYAIGDDLGFLPVYKGNRTRFTTEGEALRLIQEAAEKGRMAYQVTQSTQLVDTQKTSYTSAVKAVVKFPFLQMYAIQPAAFKAKFGIAPPVDRIYDLDLGTVSVTQKKADSTTDFAAMIRELSLSRPLFTTTVHLGGDLTAALYNEIAAQIPEIDTDTRLALFSELQASEGMNHITDHPVSDEILTGLGFDWGYQYELYVKIQSVIKNNNWSLYEEYKDEFEKYFTNNSQYWHASGKYYSSKNDAKSIDECYEILTRMSTGHLPFWDEWFFYYRSRNQWDKVDEISSRMESLFSGQRLYYFEMSFIDIFRGNYEKAETSARIYNSMTPDKADGIIPLLKVMAVTNRVDEARGIVDNYVKTAPKQLAIDLAHNISLVPELGYTTESLMPK